MEQLDTFPDGSITVDAARDAYFTHADAALYALAHNIGSDRDRDRLARLLESGPTSNADRIKLISAEFDLVKQNINVWDLEYSWTRAPRIVTLFPDILDVSTTRFLAAANQCRRLPQEKRAPLGHQPDAAFELAHGYAIKCRSFYEALEAAECLELARIQASANFSTKLARSSTGLSRLAPTLSTSQTELTDLFRINANSPKATDCTGAAASVATQPHSAKLIASTQAALRRR